MSEPRQRTFIAEVKTQSPWGWRSSLSWDELLDVAHRMGDWVAVHTDPRWGGSFDLLRQARQIVRDKPLMAKGIHANDCDIVSALEAGADYVLVVGRVPHVALDRCLLEPKSLAELCGLPRGAKAVWNSRDLMTGGRKPVPFEEARAAWAGWLCQASNLERFKDVHFGADAYLVGQALPMWEP